MNINQDDVSFVIQGTCNDIKTRHLANSIKNFWPRSEIIQSTNIANEPSGPCDIFVRVSDPGVLSSENNRNLNRQIVTSKAGILASTRPYVIKLRDDILFTKYFELSNIFREDKISFPQWYSVDPFETLQLCFHPSDWMWIGSRKLIQQYSDVQLKTKEFTDGGALLHRCEQYFCINYLQNLHPFVNIAFDIDNSEAYLSRDLFIKYFNFFNLEDYGILNQKYKISSLGLKNLITKEKFENWCKTC